MPSLEVVIGLILIILFYSLLTTIVMELISSFFSFRGKHLEKILKMILSSDDKREEILEAFKNNPVYEQLSGKYFGKKTPPSYLKAESFRAILLKVLNNRGEGGSLEEKIETLPDENLKQSLLQLLEQANYNYSHFITSVEGWYDDIMDRASGWYKRNVQLFLLLLGFVVAVIFNVDTLSIYNNLAKASDADLDRLVALAESVSRKDLYVRREGVDSLAGMREDTLYSLNTQLYEYIEENIQELDDPIGIGWEHYEPTTDLFFWLFKIFGWLITAVAISKGAPFWFDLLKKVVSFRGTGLEPAAKPKAVAEPVSAEAGAGPVSRGPREEGGNQLINKPVG